MEANNFNAVYGSCFRAGGFSGSPLWHRRLQAATSRWPIAFDPEGLPLDQGVSLNCGIRVLTTNQPRTEAFAAAAIFDSRRRDRASHSIAIRTTASNKPPALTIQVRFA